MRRSTSNESHALRLTRPAFSWKGRGTRSGFVTRSLWQNRIISMSPHRIILALATCAALCSCTGRTTTSHSASSLPTVSDVQQRFIKALGGEAAIDRPRSATLRAENVLYGPKGKTIRYTAILYLGDLKRLEIDTVPGRGRFYTGYDGTVAWQADPGRPPHEMPQKDLPTIRRDADLHYFAHIPKYFRSMTVVGIEQFAGHRCYRLRGTTTWGNENNQYYDVGNGLLSAIASTSGRTARRKRRRRAKSSNATRPSAISSSRRAPRPSATIGSCRPAG